MTSTLNDIIGRGLASARPTAGIPGRLYYSTDTGVLERDNGSSWDSVEGTTAAPTAHDHTSSGDGGVLTNPKFDGYLEVAQIGADPAAPGGSSNLLRIYAKDNGGTTTLYYITEGGTVYELPTIVTGGGGAGSGAPADAHYITTQAEAGLSAEVLLSAVIGRGVTGSRPAAGTAGRLYFDTSTGELQYDNGATWVTATPTLDQVPAAAADVSLHSHKLTSVTDPTSAQDAATKAYVDGLIVGISWKGSVRAASTAAVTIASAVENGDTLDGVTLATGDRILLKNQATASENGIWVVAASGAPARATDADTGTELLQAAVFVREGTANSDTAWVCTTDGPITAGSTALTFAQFSGVGSGTLTVREIDGSPSVTASVIEVTNAKLTDMGSGVARLDLAGSGGGSASTIYTSAYASPPASPANGDWWMPSDGAGLVYARVSGAWVARAPLHPVTEAKVADFAWVNQGTATAVDRGGLVLTAPAAAGNPNIRILKKSAPGTPYTITIYFEPHVINSGSCGLVFRESSSGFLVIWGFIGGVSNPTLGVFKYGSPTAFSATYASFNPGTLACVPRYLRIADDGTNRICSFSGNGQSFYPYHTVGRTDFMTANEVGIFADAAGTAADVSMTVLSWVAA